MKEIKVVAGKNFGDEGKGKCVDFLCGLAQREGKRPIVVRHNGGAQAGHTVEDGEFRFVFHQLGSGSRRGAPVYWAKTFLPDLLKLGDEAGSFLSVQKENPRIYANPECICTTVYDVLLNSFLESLRAEESHGSCGMGIYETVRRRKWDKEGRVTFHIGELEGIRPAGLSAMLQRIRDVYVPERVKEIKKEVGNESDNEWISLMYDDNLLHNAAEIMWENYNRFIILAEPKALFSGFDTILFENGQGLMLDQDNTPYYPHLTPSHTGLYNVRRILREAGLQNMPADIHFVTRSYVTRHGNGRLDYECTREEINPFIEDLTNMANQWQGSLRFAKHPPVAEFFEPIKNEMSANWPAENELQGKAPAAHVFVDVTHLDETGNQILFCDGAMEIGDFAACCENAGLYITIL